MATKDKQKHKTDGLEKQYPDEIKSDKWRNLWFMKDGRSYLGIKHIFASEQEALERYKEVMATHGFMHFLVASVVVKKEDISHALQIPVKD